MEQGIGNLEELREAAARFASSLVQKSDGATLVTLSGELGAGKTAFTQALAQALGVDETVTSPTFVLLKVYALPAGAAFERLIHMDAYRLEGGAELTPLGFEAVLKDPGNLILLEWPEKVANALPKADRVLTLSANADGSRTLTYA